MKKTVHILSVAFAICLVFSFNLKHPYYLGVSELKYNAKQKTINVSIRLFTNDLEAALKRTTAQHIDLINPPDKAHADTLLFHYINKRLNVMINTRQCKLNYIGYEKEEESIWAYLEIAQPTEPKKITVENALLFDFLPQQINIVHIDVNAIKKSTKLINPNKIAYFSVN